MTLKRINYKYEVILLLLKQRFHQRKLAKELNTSLKRVQSILLDLRNKNVVDYEVIGRNHVYFFKKNLITKSLILNAENYKLIKLLSKHSYLEEIFNQIISKIPNNILVLFGSYAKGLEKKDSDIDIFINITNLKLKKEIEEIYPNLSIKIGKINPKDLLIKEIIKNHIIINGGEKFYEKIKFFD